MFSMMHFQHLLPSDMKPGHTVRAHKLQPQDIAEAGLQLGYMKPKLMRQTYSQVMHAMHSHIDY